MNPTASSTWRNRLAVCNGCDACGPCCVDGVPMSYSEYKRIRQFAEALPSEERERVLNQNKRMPWPGAPEITYTACRYRDVERGRCLIYPVRPLICRLFGHVEWLPCPIQRTGPPAPSGVRLFQRYAMRELKTFEEWEESEGAVGH